MEKNENFSENLENQYSILIQANEKKEKKFYIIVMLIIILTLVSTIIACIFASKAYQASKSINITEKEGSTYYQTLNITYNNGSTLNLTGIGNGYELKNPLNISITNVGDTDITFNIKLTNIKTSLLSSNNMYYVLVKDNDSETKEVPLSEKVISSDVLIKSNQTINYTIKAIYSGQMAENDYSNYYKADIIIEQNTDKSDLLN